MEEIILSNYPPSPYAGAINAVKELSNHFHLGIVSDTGMTPGRVLRKLLQKNNILDYFCCFSFSDEVGYYKPDSRIFHHALSCLGVAPGEACHIGDFIHTDIRGAKQIGMGAILIGNSAIEEFSVDLPDFRAGSYEEILDYFMKYR
ncbi:MAG: hypothetical protein A2161_04980 [Candidatus Schekmanbacteria bacterium RBG_13_48_7]|uniref:Haloacid dehalogenase n=1 Tax=Candidatus Schekmanbacteria bacterium RBG_13_48_7 TaxID=1817878 RepID=A0A1F7RZN5_9BACT|nr:MAG: hypothetical protein A2161_04980 [Candidatus Schekmanbacteria bacterium RBG_13_48_7]